MSTHSHVSEKGTIFDQVLSFTIPERDVRGRAVRLGPVLDTVLSAHSYPTPIAHLLAEALVLTVLMGSLVQEDGGQLTIQAHANNGVVDLMVCDYRDGEVRGYANYNAEKLDQLGANPSLKALMRDGYLAITFELPATKQRYQGVVPLEGASLAEMCESYFTQSEQIPTMLRVGVRREGGHCVAGGVLLQDLPHAEEGQERLHVRDERPNWQHCSTMLASTKYEELIDPELTLEVLIWRLFHEEKRVLVEPQKALSRGCRCSIEHYRSVLSRFAAEDLADMRDPDGTIPVDCSFCSKVFHVDV